MPAVWEPVRDVGYSAGRKPWVVRHRETRRDAAARGALAQPRRFATQEAAQRLADELNRTEPNRTEPNRNAN